MSSLPRLRQVALVAHDLAPVVDDLRDFLGAGEPYRDPGVAAFGLVNAVFAIGDTFLEVVSPREPGTSAGRYLDRRRGDGGYMAMFQISDVAVARERLAALGVRSVWSADLDDISGTHLHPKDVPGAIVSLDWASPEGSWRWAGPQWTGSVPPCRKGGLVGVSIEVDDPVAAATTWAAVLGTSVAPGSTSLVLEDANQQVDFVASRQRRNEGIVEVRVTTTGTRKTRNIGGVRFERTGS